MTPTVIVCVLEVLVGHLLIRLGLSSHIMLAVRGTLETLFCWCVTLALRRRHLLDGILLKERGSTALTYPSLNIKQKKRVHP